MCSTNSASSIRGQCVEHTDYAFCVCPRFLPARAETWQYPSSDNVVPAYHCTCGHGIHAHVDYLSPVVRHCPSTHCAAYVQKTPQTQDCTCGAPLADHVAIVNSYRLPAAISYAGGIQNISPPSNTGPDNPSDNMNIILSPQPIVFSPSPNIYPSGTQLGTIQEEPDVSSCHQGLSGVFKGDSDENRHFYDPLNVMYGATSAPDALAGFSA
ncbi:hypothetical protein EV421DRAFT_330417 [Armillaria borealis]|uniref:Uncharacterized protein n=1 Tax=Armillaria borealis TaxID=47425 RepID=A0AA39MTE8_9AGAR|nr:hypothetical protein EV421DRAFT_330417 [Armillaria borealis]